MKVKDLITKVELQEAEISQLNARFEVSIELNKMLEKRIEELERFHPSIYRGGYEGWPPRKGIPHDHRMEDEK